MPRISRKQIYSLQREVLRTRSKINRKLFVGTKLNGRKSNRAQFKSLWYELRLLSAQAELLSVLIGKEFDFK